MPEFRGLFACHHDQLQIADTAAEGAFGVAFIDHQSRPVPMRAIDLEIDFLRQQNTEMAQGAMGVFIELPHQSRVDPAPRKHRTEIVDNPLAHIMGIDHEFDGRIIADILVDRRWPRRFFGLRSPLIGAVLMANGRKPGR